VAVAPSDIRPHNRRARPLEGREDRAGCFGANERGVDKVHEHRVHAGPVRHRQPGEQRGELSLLPARVLDDSGTQTGRRD